MAVYQVSQVATYIKDVLYNDPVLTDIWVEGEVANLSRPPSGHTYFSLSEGRSTLRMVMFRGDSVGSEQLEVGSTVIAHARVSFYEARGDLQLVADLIQPQGVGELQLKLEELQLRLEKEGFFEKSRKRPVAVFPRKVGVVTSPSGSVWHDIQNVIGRRYPLVELVLAPALVQGESAAPSVVAALERLAGEPEIDTVIIARGGGSLEDLWPFNEEIVARAIFASRIPVVSAIGHETDTTVSDMVADLRAPTPSAAAEMVVPDQEDLLASIRASNRYLLTALTTKADRLQENMGYLVHRLSRRWPDVETLILQVDDLLQTTHRHLGRYLHLQKERTDGLGLRVQALSPAGTLRRGYAIVQKQRERTVITDPRQVGRDESLEVTVSEGHFVVKASGSGGSVSKQHPPESDPPHGGQLPLLHAPSDAEEESS